MSTRLGDSLYELVLNNISTAGAGGSGPALPPSRPSAAVVPWRRTAGADETAIEVYWVRRAAELPFMGGWHAFPGGGLSRADAAVPVDGHPAGAGEGPPAAGFPESLGGGSPDPRINPGPDLVPGLVVCALRELFEETGLLLATPSPGPAVLAAAQKALLAKEKSFADVLAGLGTRLDASRLVWAGRWVTPPFAPVRFDNRFFLLEWPASEPVQPEVLPGELTEGEWIAPAAALARCREETLAAPPILHILEVLAQDGPDLGIDRLRDPAETNLGPLRRIEMRPGVLMIPLATYTLPPAFTTNAYLLGTEETVLVDPGSPLDAENERLERALTAARDRLGRRVTAIWLTHHHPDHTGGVERLRRFLNVPVLAHPATAERLAGRLAVDGTLADNQRIVLAGDPPFAVRVLHTPGHARGHLCFLAESHGSVLAGDLVAGLGTIVVDPPEGDMDDYLASLARLADLHPRTLFPAHGPAIQNAVAKLREYIEHRLWREEKVAAAWDQGLRTPGEMLPTVYEDVPKEAYPLAERQILAHLARLRKAGRIE
ncbi:MAG TPA: MBL fold metallo-hydrolase [Thermoanaerobaculia bacterium]|jgi:glyoxylase-like metal-dependent hydrolase (beta-lactamase superfamily II)/8-oxo-dGTP pyrophosphatase MutT (NUDIX family)|nr:MBL fold metallo-hydrolase [Thermoanaerobaculia bacterium]